jgi:hypothetical protein
MSISGLSDCKKVHLCAVCVGFELISESSNYENTML